MENDLLKLLKRSFLGGLLLFARSLAGGGRVHPTCRLIGNWTGAELGSAKIGERCVLDVGTKGRIVLEGKVWIARDVELQTAGIIHVGNGTTIQRRSTLAGNVTLGCDCIIAPNVFISSGTHPFRLRPHLTIREQERLVESGNLPADHLDRPVQIGDDCWLGANVVVCPGVSIGSGSVVGANSVVTKDVPSNTVVAGCPARNIGVR
jgi:acetyltransferase-like isoleucine patch superfamily enzyme